MNSITDELIKLIFTILTVVLVPLLVALAAKVLKRVGLSVEAEQQAKIEKLVQDAILATEEYARAQLKSQLTKVLPQEKFNRAVTQVLDKVPGITEAEAVALVQQELPKVRTVTGDFLKATSQAVAQ